ncbi:hypothetical protein K3495_g12701 [Podosphaera aphanis]|nr:hypothetical protein K3495_g12701 [Podosphaera aphanis]
MYPITSLHYFLTKSRLTYKNCGKIFTSSFCTITASTLPPLPPRAAYCFLPNRRLLAISGPDSTRYLQGAITANVNADTTHGFYAAFLNAQGRLLNDVFIYPYEEEEGKYKGQQGWLVEVDAKQVENLARRIKRYKLSSKFEVRVLPTTERAVWSVWNDADDKMHDTSLSNYLKQRMGCVDGRALGMGLRVLLSGDRKPELDMEEIHHDCYRLRRYLKGVPEGQDELIPEQAFPQESNIDLMGGIDYRKGCYVGQELTIRTHHTGVIRKRILPLQLYDLDQEKPQALAYDPNRNFGVENIPLETRITRWKKGERSVGRWLHGIGNIGLGLCRLATMTNLVEGDEAVYQPDDEFKLEWRSEEGLRSVKVTAIPPPGWHSKQQSQ